MSNTTSHDDITSGSDLIATYNVEGVKGIFSGSVTAAGMNISADMTTVDVNATGSVNATVATAAPKAIITATNTTACVFIVSSSAAPAVTDYAYPGSLWFYHTPSVVAGSLMANACLYINCSASGASGSLWKVVKLLDA